MLRYGLQISSKLLDLGWVTLGLVLYFLVRGSVVDRQIQAAQNSEMIINFEKAAHLFFEPHLNHWTASNELVSHIFNNVYFWFHFPVIAVTGIVLSLIARPVFVLLRNSILLSGGVSLVIYWLFPVSPPRLVQGHDFVDTMGLFSQVSYQAQVYKSIRGNAFTSCWLGFIVGFSDYERFQKYDSQVFFHTNFFISAYSYYLYR
jgi:hypothetical protein